MRRQPRWTLIVATLACCVYWLSSGVRAEVDIRVFVPAFAGPGSLGLNVATILNLQVWQTLRRAPTPNPTKLDFGSGQVIWDQEPLDEPSHARAEAMGRLPSIAAQFVLWGKAYEYGHGVVVQSYLTIPAESDPGGIHNEMWTVYVPTRSGKVRISRDIPARRYAFEPIVLDTALVNSFSSPSALKISRDPQGSQQIGSVGPEFRALEQQADRVRITSRGLVGWLQLPHLSANRSEVVDFVGALVRIFRGDWAGAEALLVQVDKNLHTPASIRTDTRLYLGLAAEQQGRSGRTTIQSAVKDNRLSQAAAAYLVMACFSEYARTHRPGAEAKDQPILQLAGDTLSESRFLFAEDDPWFQQATRLYRSVSQEAVANNP